MFFFFSRLSGHPSTSDFMPSTSYPLMLLAQSSVLFTATAMPTSWLFSGTLSSSIYPSYLQIHRSHQKSTFPHFFFHITANNWFWLMSSEWTTATIMNGLTSLCMDSKISTSQRVFCSTETSWLGTNNKARYTAKFYGIYRSLKCMDLQSLTTCFVI